MSVEFKRDEYRNCHIGCHVAGYAFAALTEFRKLVLKKELINIQEFERDYKYIKDCIDCMYTGKNMPEVAG
jgi:hypothetical protein